MLAEGLALGRERRAALAELLRTDPASALVSSWPAEDRAALPATIAAELEESIAARGQLAIFQTCFHPAGENAPPHHDHTIGRTAIIDGRAFRVHTYGTGLERPSSADTDLTGIAIGQDLALAAPPLIMADNGGSNSGLPPVASPDWSIGDKRLLVIRIDFSDLPGAPINHDDNAEITPTFIDSVINGAGGVRTFFQASSYGATDLLFDPATDVTPVLRMSQTALSYATTENRATYEVSIALHNEARAAAALAGFDEADYDRVVVVYSDLSALPGSEMTFSGLAYIARKYSWINGFLTPVTLAHELGHNYGLTHADLRQSTDGDPLSLTSANIDASGDPFNIMGSGSTLAQDFSQWDKVGLGWIPDASITLVETSGVYRIHRLDAAQADLNLPRVVRLARDPDRDYLIGYRRGQASPALANGAYVLWTPRIRFRESQLLDLVTPLADASDAPLPIGQTLNDTASGITITPIAQGGTGADEWLELQITMPPRLAWSPSSVQVDEHGGFAELLVTRTGDSTAAASVTYTTVDDTATAPADYTTTSGVLSWASGDTAPKSVLVPLVSDALVEAEEAFTVTLFDPAGAVVIEPDVRVAIAAPGDRDRNYAPNSLAGQVTRLLAEPDGKLIAAGSFTSVTPYPDQVRRLARLDADGNPDTTFALNDGPNNAVLALARQPDGKLLIGGAFTQYDATSAKYLARLLPDGTLDPTFQIGQGPSNQVETILVLPDERILVGGSFTFYDGTPREYLVRLLPDGSLDTSFIGPDFFGSSTYKVTDLALQLDGKILVAGNFFRLEAPYRADLIRLLPDGAPDETFNGYTQGAHPMGAVFGSSTILRVSPQPDGKIIIAGNFTAFDTVARDRVARLNADGSLDTDFNPSFNNTIFGLLPLPDGSHVFSGTFTEVDGQSASRIARLRPDGSLDADFALHAGLNSGGAYTLARLPDERLLVGGDFTTYLGSPKNQSVWRLFSGVPGRNGIAQFSASTASTAEAGVASLTVNREGGSYGSLRVGYSTVPDSADTTDFTTTTGVLTWADGDTTPKTIQVPIIQEGVAEPEESFRVNLGQPLITSALLGQTQQATVTIAASPEINRRARWQTTAVSILATLPSVTLIVERSGSDPGAFSVAYTTIDGTATAPGNYVSGSGQLDWEAGDLAPKTVNIPLVANDLPNTGKTFTVALSPVGLALIDGPSSATVSLLDPGLRDPAFLSAAIGSGARRVLALPDGKVLVAGKSFDAVSPLGSSPILRLNADGSLDPTFAPGSGANNTIRALARQPDGKYIIGGEFTTYDGAPALHLARLHPDGTLDTTFSASADNTVYSLLCLPDGRILLGGAFTTINGQGREFLARLHADGSLDTTFVGPDFPAQGGAQVFELALQADGKLLVAGFFYLSGGSPFRSGICRLDTTGALDPSFDGITHGSHNTSSTGSLAPVRSVAALPDGSILVSGDFTAFNGVARGRFARLASNGALDPAFDPSFNSSVAAILPLPDGSIVVSGNFTTLNGVASPRLARLAADGTPTPGFGFNGGLASNSIYHLALQPDGSVLLATDSAAFQDSDVARPLWRLNTSLPISPGVVQFSTPTAAVERGGSATLTVTRTGGTVGALTIGYATVLDTADATEFTPTTGLLTWADGDDTPREIVVPTTANDLAVGDTRFLVNLGQPLLGGTLLGEFQQIQVTLANLDLTSLIISQGALDPTFAPNVLAYTASVGPAVGSLTLTPVAVDPQSVVTVNSTVVTSGTASPPQSLAQGINHIAVTVSRPELGLDKTYTLAITRGLSLVLNGGGLTLLAEGGTFALGNLATGGTAFAKNQIGVAPHTITGLNDGTYGNSSSWIGNSTDTFAGIKLGSTPVPVNRIAFGRDNLAAFSDRTLNLYTLQYTTAPQPDATTTEWTTIGTLDYLTAGLENFLFPSRRHHFCFDTVIATGLRLVTAAPGIGIDEIDLYFVVSTAADWRLLYFGSTAATGQAADLADPDGDGLANLLEYALAREPLVADSGTPTTASIQRVDGQDYLTLTYRRRIAAPDLVFTVESSGTLIGAWDENAVQLGSAINHGNDTETVTYRDSVPRTDATRRFMRLRVTRPNWSFLKKSKFCYVTKNARGQQT